MYFKFQKYSIFYKKYGNNSNKMLILPGWGETRETFKYIIDYFKENYEIYILDYPGFGNSPFINKELTIYDYALIVKSFIEKEKIDNPIIIAHSFGGRITAILSGLYKIKINKIVLLDVAGIKRRKTLKQLIKEKIYKLLKFSINILPFKNKEEKKNKLLNIFASTDYKNIPIAMHKTFKNIINEDLKKYYKNIDEETLIIWGEKDQDTPLKDAYLLNKIINNSGLIIYNNSTHFSYLENIYKTNIIIEKFIKKED